MAFSMKGVQLTRRQTEHLVLLLGVLGIAICGGPTVKAFANEGALTTLLSSKAFSGSMEVVQKFNWLGGIMNFVISSFSLIGLFMLMYQRIVTFLYFGSRQTWDTVADLKKTGEGDAFFGIPGMGKTVWEGNAGTGLDAIVGFGLMILPNVKAYSDYSENAKGVKNLTEDDTAADYFLKTLPQTIILGFIFTIGFSGTLFKGYGMVIDGLAAAADHVVEQNLEGLVKRTLNSGGGHQFTLGSDKSATGEFGEKIAREIYSKVLARMNTVDTNSKMIIGRNVEAWVAQEILGGASDAAGRIESINEIAQTAITDSTTDNLATQIRTDADVRVANTRIQITNTAYMGSESAKIGRSAAMLETFLEGTQYEVNTTADKELHVHVMISKSRLLDSNYFENAGGPTNKGPSVGGDGNGVGGAPKSN